jgi:hypothetical protein
MGLQQVMHTYRRQGGKEEQHDPTLARSHQHQGTETQASQGNEKGGVSDRVTDLVEIKH